MIRHLRASRRRVYRTRDASRALAISTVVTLALVALAVVPGRAEAAGYVGAPLWAIATWRAWRLGVHVDESGVTVSGVLYSRRVAWSDIDHFAVMPSGSYPYVGHIVRSDAGRPVAIMSMSAPRGKSDAHRLEVERPVDELNGLLAAWRTRTRGA